MYQVALSISNKKTEQREVEALQQAMKELDIKIGTIVTLDKRQELKIDNKIINCVPLRDFLLSESIKSNEGSDDRK